ncbi:metallophosphoesterase [Serratia sp. M24T3]|uniref:metallophosphoesterase n=1 Tax=Serratia sp. M24T3 TaxID=932213 RepID=UPI00025B9150|nr:metallophosphoesterase [Serratia sp. M24T3]EIC84016.1 serine/threonine-protein phosphatase 1 [Serratia sp. M24T3]
MSERNGVYQRINGDQYRNVFVVGDLHGCYQRLITQLEELAFNRHEDLLISVGDLIDRGPQNVECLDLQNEKWFVAVRGNHEQMAIDTISGKDDGRLWFGNGGSWYWTLDEEQRLLATRLIERAKNSPLVIEVNIAGESTVICHADYPSDHYLFGKPISESDAVWSRERFNALSDGPQTGIEGAKAFYFGHTPIQRPAKAANLNYIDTGAVFGGQLTIVKIKGGDNG